MQIIEEKLRSSAITLALIMAKFRFQGLTIWQDAVELTDVLFDLADHIEGLKRFQFAEQLRGATLSISNNIAEGSGSIYPRDFARFLNISRRSAFEVANMLIILHRRQLISNEALEYKLQELDILCRKITRFKQSLLRSN